MRKKKNNVEELAQLNQELTRVRQESLAASRNNEFRAVARLTAEAAKLNRLILAAEGAMVPALMFLGDELFTSTARESVPKEERRARAVAEFA
jgi:hypothetical protein